MVFSDPLHLHHRLALATLLAGVCMSAVPMQSASHAEPPWRIESFCHRGAPPARRCLVQARQGIFVFWLAELAAAPAVSWNDGLAVLTSAGRDGSLRFFMPP